MGVSYSNSIWLPIVDKREDPYFFAVNTMGTACYVSGSSNTPVFASHRSLLLQAHVPCILLCTVQGVWVKFHLLIILRRSIAKRRRRMWTLRMDSSSIINQMYFSQNGSSLGQSWLTLSNHEPFAQRLYVHPSYDIPLASGDVTLPFDVRHLFPRAVIISFYVQVLQCTETELYPMQFTNACAVKRSSSRLLSPRLETGRLPRPHMFLEGEVSAVSVWLCVSFSLVIRPHFDCTTTTCDFSARIVRCLAIRVVPCLFCSSLDVLPNNILITLAFVPFSGIATIVKCSGTIMPSTCNIPPMHLLIYVIWSDTSTARLWTILNQVWACTSPLVQQIRLNPEY